MTADPRLRPFLLERFADFLALEKGSSARTQEAYARDTVRFAGFAIVKGTVSRA